MGETIPVKLGEYFNGYGVALHASKMPDDLDHINYPFIFIFKEKAMAEIVYAVFLKEINDKFLQICITNAVKVFYDRQVIPKSL